MKSILGTLLILLLTKYIMGQQYGRRRVPTQGAVLSDTSAHAHGPLPVHVPEETTYKPKVYEVYSQIAPNIGDGKFEYYVETSDGLQSEQIGYQNHRPHGSQVQEGAYTTLDDAGKVVRVNYIADKDGFRVSGQSLPTSPPIPFEHVKAREDILRQQEEIRQQHLGNFRAAHAAHGRKY